MQEIPVLCVHVCLCINAECIYMFFNGGVSARRWTHARMVWPWPDMHITRGVVWKRETRGKSRRDLKHFRRLFGAVHRAIPWNGRGQSAVEFSIIGLQHRRSRSRGPLFLRNNSKSSVRTRKKNQHAVSTCRLMSEVNKKRAANTLSYWWGFVVEKNLQCWNNCVQNQIIFHSRVVWKFLKSAAVLALQEICMQSRVFFLIGWDFVSWETGPDGGDVVGKRVPANYVFKVYGTGHKNVSFGAVRKKMMAVFQRISATLLTLRQRHKLRRYIYTHTMFPLPNSQWRKRGVEEATLGMEKRKTTARAVPYVPADRSASYFFILG